MSFRTELAAALAAIALLSAVTFAPAAAQEAEQKEAMDLAAWRQDLVGQGLIELPVSGDIAVQAARLNPFHGDPADRLIAATAVLHSLTLLTADERLLGSELATKRMDARD
jgi:PIN domain nuclease of toxin-antitoxin system